MGKLCGLFGYSRQAYYQDSKRNLQHGLEEEIILEMVLKVRKRLKRIGGRKLYSMISSEIRQHGLRLGRDAFFDLLRWNGLLIRRRRKRVFTTYSSHWLHKHPNLLKGMEISQPNQVWVSDITYIDTDNGFSYLFLITDAYSRKILSHYLSSSLRVDGAMRALEEAINQSEYPLEGLIHHSDRGIQYCSEEYTQMLRSFGIRISMTETGDPRENAIAERVNGILKEEWIYLTHYANKEQASTEIRQIICDYNDMRPHMSLDMSTPSEAYLKTGPLKKWWKIYSRRLQTQKLTITKDENTCMSTQSTFS